MMRVLLLLGALFLVSPASAEEEAVKQTRAPFELTRSLNALQDQIALGNEAAFAAQQGLLRELGEQMLGFDRAIWREPVNARAAIGFVLSGGEAELLRVLLAEDALPAEEAVLAGAAFAYAMGRWDEASAGFGEVDARRLPPVLGAHVALVQAGLAMRDAPEEARRHLENARLLAPGTLVEEAALRRQLSIESRLGQVESFSSLATHYFRRFPNSIYGANFRHAFPELWAGLSQPSGETSHDQLDLILAELEPEMSQDVYLSVARMAALSADRELARHAASRVRELSPGSDGDRLRASLYAASVETAGGDPVEARGMLAAIDRKVLSAEDASLHDAALAVLNAVEAPPAELRGDGPDDIPPLPLANRAREIIAATDVLLRSMP